MKWKFTPYDLDEWNKSSSRVLFVASEPNGDNPNGGIKDMGNWFRTAKDNGYHSNKLFHNRCRMILNGVLKSESESNFNHFRFMDLKATAGGARANKIEIANYIKNNKQDVMQYFVSEDENFGLRPHVTILLGNLAYELFSQHLRNEVQKENQELRWVQMPHPSAQTVHNESLLEACGEINKHLCAIDKAADKWFCRGQNNNGWVKATP
jgi:hypothetical protein